MKKNKYQKITARALEHALTWGDHMCKLQSWTKSDTNTYASIREEVKRLRHKEYLRNKAIKMNPYIDPSNPPALHEDYEEETK